MSQVCIEYWDEDDMAKRFGNYAVGLLIRQAREKSEYGYSFNRPLMKYMHLPEPTRYITEKGVYEVVLARVPLDASHTQYGRAFALRLDGKHNPDNSHVLELLIGTYKSERARMNSLKMQIEKLVDATPQTKQTSRLIARYRTRLANMTRTFQPIDFTTDHHRNSKTTHTGYEVYFPITVFTFAQSPSLPSIQPTTQPLLQVTGLKMIFCVQGT